MSATFTAVVLLSLLSCVTTGLGVAIALRLRENVRVIAAGIGFSTGIMILMMLFVSLHELVPMAKRYRHPDSFVWGIGLSALVYALLATMTVRLIPVVGI